MARLTRRAGFYTGGAQIVSSTAQLLTTVLISRVLPPGEIGLVAMVLTATALFALMRDAGLSPATIQASTVTRDQVDRIFFFNLVLGISLAALLVLTADLVAAFYRQPELAPLLKLASIGLPLAAAAAQPLAQLQRHLQFGRKAIIDIATVVSSSVTSLILAHRGFGAASLIWGVVAGAATQFAFSFVLSGYWPRVPRGDWAGFRSLAVFGGHLTAMEVASLLSRQLDSVLIGRVAGAWELGIYNRAYQLIMFPIVNMRTPISALAFPILSRLKDNEEAFRESYASFTSLLAFLSMGLASFLFVVSADVVTLLLGPQWSGVGPVFSILVLVAFVQPVSSFRGVVLMSLGKGGLYLRQGLIVSAVTCAGFAIGASWGAVGVALAYVATTYVLIIPINYLCFKNTPVRGRDFFSATLPFCTSSLAAALLIYMVGLMHHEPSWTWLLFRAALYVAAYFLLLSMWPSVRAATKRLI